MSIDERGLHTGWTSVRAELKQRWSQLTEEDLQLLRSDAEQLIGRIQERTGEARESVEAFLGELLARGSAAVSQATETVGGYAHRAGDRIHDRYSVAADEARLQMDRARELTRQNPLTSLAVVFGVGVVAGLIVGVSLRSR